MNTAYRAKFRLIRYFKKGGQQWIEGIQQDMQQGTPVPQGISQEVVGRFQTA
jgi:hypothetical protein